MIYPLIAGEHVATFTLTAEHIHLLRALRWGRTWYHIDTGLPQKEDIPYPGYGLSRPFGDSSVEASAAVLLGLIEDGDDLTDEHAARVRTMISELCDEIQIVMSLATFDPGEYILFAVDARNAAWCPAQATTPETREIHTAKKARAAQRMTRSRGC